MTALQKASNNRKQTFLGGAAVLALATAAVKVIGAIYDTDSGEVRWM